MLIFTVVGLALVPVSLALASEPQEKPQPQPSVVADSILWVTALGLAGVYGCAITALKFWAAVRPTQAA